MLWYLQNNWVGVAWAFGPMLLVGLLFWWIMVAIVHSDRNERKAYAKIEAEERAKRRAKTS